MSPRSMILSYNLLNQWQAEQVSIIIFFRPHKPIADILKYLFCTHEFQQTMWMSEIKLKILVGLKLSHINISCMDWVNQLKSKIDIY